LKTGLMLLLSLGSVAAGLSLSTSQRHGADARFLTAPVEIAKVASTVSASGGVDAVVTVDVSSQLSGLVQEVFVDFNDRVRKGQPLARLDQEGFQATVREAEANLAVAQVNVQSKRAAVDRAVNAYETMKAEARVLAARTAEARAGSDNAGRMLERKEALRKKGHISDAELDTARAEFETARAGLEAAEAEEAVHREKIATAESEMQQAAVEAKSALAAVPQTEAVLRQAKVELERSVIRAPIDGVVILREVEPGQTVAASLEAPTLFRIAEDLSRMEVLAKVDEADIGEIRPGQRVGFTVDAYPGRRFEGRVVQVRKAPQVVQNVVIYTVVISTANPDLLLLPGMTAMVEIVVRESGETLTVPSAALRFEPPADLAEAAEERTSWTIPLDPRGEPATLWVADETGRSAPVTVATGMTDGIATQILGVPLAAGQRVIVGLAETEEEASFLGLRFGF
jgi:HlyD family secretion protein